MAKRINFGKLQEVLPIPDLIGLQIDSYRDFLQKDVPPADRINAGLQEVFNEICCCQSHLGTAADAAADQHICLDQLQQPCQSAVAAAAGVHNGGGGNAAVGHRSEERRVGKEC